MLRINEISAIIKKEYREYLIIDNSLSFIEKEENGIWTLPRGDWCFME